MGMQAKIKYARRSDRMVKRQLEVSGVADRARAAYLGLRREDVQADIRTRYESNAPWAERPGLIEVAGAALVGFGYDLAGLEVKVKFLPGRHHVVGGEVVQEPHRAQFTADISAEALAVAERAAGARLSGRPGAALSN